MALSDLTRCRDASQQVVAWGAQAPRSQSLCIRGTTPGYTIQKRTIILLHCYSFDVVSYAVLFHY